MALPKPALWLVDYSSPQNPVFGPCSVFFRIRTGIPDVVVLSSKNFEMVCLVNRFSIKFY